MSLRTGTDRDLLKELSQMDGRPYGAYRSLAGTWDYGDFTVAIDRVQSDPYAPPSVLRATISSSHFIQPWQQLARMIPGRIGDPPLGSPRTARSAPAAPRHRG